MSNPDPEIPNSRSPDSRFGRESGRESPIPDSAEIGNREIPRFPAIWPGIGNRGPDWPQIGKSGIPLRVSTSCTILSGLDVALSPSNADSGLPPHFNCLNCQDRPMEDDSDREMADYGTGFSDDVDRNFDALRTCACGWIPTRRNHVAIRSVSSRRPLERRSQRANPMRASLCFHRTVNLFRVVMSLRIYYRSIKCPQLRSSVFRP